MKYSFKQIINSLPKEKRGGDSLIGRLVCRPLSYPLTYLCVNAGISAWSISFFSVLLVFAGCILYSCNLTACKWVGISLILLWTVFDCVDGNIARTTGSQNEFGAFMDAQSGYVACGFIYLSLGISAFYHTSLFLNYPELLIVFGSVASIFDVLSRLIFQKYQNARKDYYLHHESTSERKQSFLSYLRIKISAEIGIAGMVPILMLLAIIFPVLLDYIVIFYLVFNAMAFAFVCLVCSIKSRKS